MAEPLFPADHNFKPIYLHHRALPPRFVRSEAEKMYLINSKQWSLSYRHQAWPQLRYHKAFSIDIERAPDTVEFFSEKTGQVDERARQAAITLRNKQRQRAVRAVANDAQADKLGKDWMVYADLPAEKKRVAQEAKDNEADLALYGGPVDEFTDGDHPVVMGETLRGGVII